MRVIVLSLLTLSGVLLVLRSSSSRSKLAAALRDAAETLDVNDASRRDRGNEMPPQPGTAMALPMAADPEPMPPSDPLETQRERERDSGVEPTETEKTIAGAVFNTDEELPDPDVVLPPLDRASDGLDAIRTIHTRLRTLVEMGASGPDAVSKTRFLNELVLVFQDHDHLERDVLHPWLLRIGLGPSYVETSEAELDAIDRELRELSSIEPDSPQFDGGLLVLRRLVLGHVNRDQGPMFEFAEHASAADRQDLLNALDSSARPGTSSE